MNRIFPLIVTALVLCCHASADTAAAIERLARVDHFAFGGIGAAGITSPGEVAFRELMRGASAQSDLLRLFNSANPQGRCYALVGFRLLNQIAFDEKADKAEKRGGTVKTIAGCIVMDRPMASVISSIRKGDYDLKAKTPRNGLPRP